jgi:hypothetical protein
MRFPPSHRPLTFSLGLAALLAPIAVAFVIALFPASSTGKAPYAAAPAPLPTSIDGAEEDFAAQALQPILMAWLSFNFDLPAVHDRPRVEIASVTKMAEVRYSRLTSLGPDRVAAEAGRAAPTDIGRDVFAIYDDKTRTIYLREGWTSATPADVSLLVHEMVHHIQNVAGLAYDCPQAREKPAYAAQARWLELFGKTLAEEFEIDPMTVLVRTNCLN